MSSQMNWRRPSRRVLLAGGAAAMAAPWVIGSGRAADRQLLVRTPGGEYDEIMRKAVYEPFRQATGISVTTVPATMSKLLAMLKAGDSELDVVDATAEGLAILQIAGGLSPIAYDKWKFAKVDDLIPAMRSEYRVAIYAYAFVSAYSTAAFPTGKHPGNWAEFWDMRRFPGPRTLYDMKIGQAPLEFALLAAGAPRESLYPLDIDAAFKSLSRIRSAVPKFWDSGALSTQMLADKEVVLGAVANGRVQTLIDKGLPLAIEWNQCMLQLQAYGILKNGNRQELAQSLIDFASQPAPQAEYAKMLKYGPSNGKAYELLSADLVASLPGGPISREKGFFGGTDWWVKNLDTVSKKWSAWILG